MPFDSATTIAAALDAPERAKQPKKAKSEKTAKTTKKSPKAIKAHRPGRESTKTITNRLYSLWAQIVRGLAGNKCEVCGRENSPSAPLNAHHIMPRQFFTGLRFDPKNGCCLCPRCHKLGKYSAHKGGIWFADWLKNKNDGRYLYCLSHADDELDCKDRVALYKIETGLHYEYEAIIGKLPAFFVEAITKSGMVVHGVPGDDGGTLRWLRDTLKRLAVYAHNKKAAETSFTSLWNALNPQDQIKGVVKAEKLKGCAERFPQEALDAVASEPIPVLNTNH